MTATSVTGVGNGSVEGANKGNPNQSVGAERIVGPRVMAADQVTTDGSGDKVIKLPAFTGTASDYIVLATDAHATAAAAVAAALTMDSTSTTLTIKGPTSSAVNYAVIKRGIAL